MTTSNSFDTAKFYTCLEDEEDLHHSTAADAVDEFLEGFHLEDDRDALMEALDEPLTIFAFNPMRVTPEMVYAPLEGILERLDEEYGDWRQDPTKPSPAMVKAEVRLREIVAAEYEVWSCEKVGELEVTPREWVKENDLGWVQEFKNAGLWEN